MLADLNHRRSVLFDILFLHDFTMRLGEPSKIGSSVHVYSLYIVGNLGNCDLYWGFLCYFLLKTCLSKYAIRICLQSKNVFENWDIGGWDLTHFTFQIHKCTNAKYTNTQKQKRL